MEFRLDKHTNLPVVAQLQEQIKIALLLGQLRPGDTLPSIRDVETQLGISRNLVRQAYVELEDRGILKLHHGKGVLVQKHLNYSNRTDKLNETEQLVKETLNKLEKIGVLPSAFAKYLYQRAIEAEAAHPHIVYADVRKQIAAERASQISAVWRTNIPAISFDELARISSDNRPNIKVLTNYIRYDEVRAMVKKKGIEVIPVGFTVSEETLFQFSRLSKNSSVVFIFDDQDYPALQLIVEPYKQLLSQPSVQLKFTAIPISKVKGLQSLVRSRRYALVVVSNRIWETLDPAIRKLPGITRPQLRIDLASLEEVRIKAGIIV
jgi:DNA-binding transcriptional regulator YhcF (GntR family)